jgi:hypothetical protein
MTIRLETSQRSGIHNYQDTEISAFHLNWAKDLSKKYPAARNRTSPSPTYNCHGLTFASRRTRIEKSIGIQTIIADDKYEEIPMKGALPGDIVIYYSDSWDPNHSGIVVQSGGDLLLPLICSKWGNAGEFVHALRDCPALYGPNLRFFRCRR